MSPPQTVPAPVPVRRWRILAGMLSAAAAVGVGHGVAAAINPAASPLLAVGSALIDAAPTSAKTFFVRLLGNWDKPFLLSMIGIVLLIFAGVLGLLAWRYRPVALIGISLLGLVGLAVSVLRGTVADGIPSIVAGLVGVGAMWLLSRPATARSTAPDRDDPSPVSRRRLLLGLAGTAVLAAAGGFGGQVIARTKQAASAARRAIGLPAPASAATVIPAGAQLEGMTPFTTSIEKFYRVDISLITPSVDPGDWDLTIDGMVDTPMTLSYDDLLAMPMIERDITLTCVSNEVGGSYVGTARWLGVPFAEIIKRVGVKPGVDQVFSYSSDSGYTCSTPYQAVSDGRDAMIVVGMNGEVLPEKNGFPARMLVPGLFGFVSATKWLRRIEFTTYTERTAYWTERKWATDSPILTQSRIDVPKSLGTLDRAKPVLAGVAWAQHRGIEKVEIRIDGGAWRDTKLANEAGIDLWRQWSYVYDGPAGRHSAQVRATDKTGGTQPEERTKVFPSGARGWHEIQFTAE